jgi:small subunit ribosomal protein S2
MQSTLNREYQKIYRNLNGMRDMDRLPECLVIVDPTKERNAVREARLLGIKVVALIDTDSDPDLVDLPIPGNDDSLRSIRLIMQHLSDAVKQGRSLRPDENRRKEESAADVYKAVPSIRD